MTPILMLGAGRMGGALVEGWRRAGAFAAAELILRDPYPTDTARAVEADGARLNPPDAALAEAKTVILAVKPQIWRETAAEVAHLLAPDALIVSVCAGVRADDIGQAFGGRRVARVMPTTAVAINQGTISLFAADAEGRARAHALFEPVGAVVDLDDEDLLHAATGVSGSAPAYFYAFVEALEAGGVAAGLPPEAARTLARATMTGAAALLAASGEEPADLRRQVTSPNGTTEAALKVLMADDGLGPLLSKAVIAATRRSKELGG
ncbi:MULTISPECIES: pyrroline-5-carboxylate reductase [Phenylobacterium]|jgi:pyrroline-5-carboxylate reductase|uniref:Pyrroline-5-carboxylate reductase n=1 Tax=Phenylobacterium conjunctum TaxID=1298959 RepID=A0ABW3T6C3_9CAUL